jgi:hypothetical protein
MMKEKKLKKIFYAKIRQYIAQNSGLLADN